METARQLDLLDRYADTEAAQIEVGALVGAWEVARAELQRIADEAREGKRQEDLSASSSPRSTPCGCGKGRRTSCAPSAAGCSTRSASPPASPR